MAEERSIWDLQSRLGVGAVLGGVILVLGVGLVIWDLSRGAHGGHAPPAWYGGPDLVPERQEICAGPDGRPAVDPQLVREHNRTWESLCWAPWPDPVPDPVVCDGAPAPDGVVRWHSCDETRIVHSERVLPCVDSADPSKTRRGATWAHRDNGVLLSADIYVRVSDPLLPMCVYSHEGGHARGILGADGRDSHTTLEHSLMYAGCTDDYTTVWLDRCSGGDWPW